MDAVRHGWQFQQPGTPAVSHSTNQNRTLCIENANSDARLGGASVSGGGGCCDFITGRDARVRGHCLDSKGRRLSVELDGVGRRLGGTIACDINRAYTRLMRAIVEGKVGKDDLPITLGVDNGCAGDTSQYHFDRAVGLSSTLDNNSGIPGDAID